MKYLRLEAKDEEVERENVGTAASAVRRAQLDSLLSDASGSVEEQRFSAAPASLENPGLAPVVVLRSIGSFI